MSCSLYNTADHLHLTTDFKHKDSAAVFVYFIIYILQLSQSRHVSTLNSISKCYLSTSSSTSPY